MKLLENRLYIHLLQKQQQHVVVQNNNTCFLFDRFEEAKDELLGLLEDDRLRDSPLLLLANKQDLPNAASPAEITDRLGLGKFRSGRDWYIQRTSAVTGEGLVDGLTWLAEKIKARKSRRLV